MKYLRLFPSDADYQSYKEGESYVTPNVSLVTENNSIHFNPVPPPMNIITYYATDKLVETTATGNTAGLHVNAFNSPMVSHEFVDGVGVITFEEDVTTIGNYAFYNCSGMTGALIIPDSVTSIGSQAFYQCSRLTEVTIPDGVTSIGNTAFYKCTGLESIVVSSGNTVYDSRENCNCLIKTSTNELIQGCNNSFFPDGVTSIGQYAFYGCTKLTGELIIPDSVTTIGHYAFTECYGLKEVTIGSGVTSIGGSAFQNCTGLPIENNLRYADTYLVEAVDKTQTTYIIKETTKWIGEYAFQDCSRLTGITIPDSVTTIGNYAFDGCSRLTGITIPDSVTTIGNYVFDGCSGLTEITCHAVTAPSVQSYTFYRVKSGGTLYVPAGSTDSYSTWMNTVRYYLGYYNWTIQELSE